MDDAKKKILARRAQFVAAAIASIGVTSCGKDTARPCLSPPADPDAAMAPQPCLSVPIIATPADADVPTADASAADAGISDAATTKPKPDAAATTPRPCLSAQPRPCLKQRPPGDLEDPF